MATLAWASMGEHEVDRSRTPPLGTLDEPSPKRVKVGDQELDERGADVTVPGEDKAPELPCRINDGGAAGGGCAVADANGETASPQQNSEVAVDSALPTITADALPPVAVRALIEEPIAEQEEAWTKDKLPLPREHELEFILKDPRSFRQGTSILSPIRQLPGSFRFRLLVFPAGTESTGRPEQLAAFVEVVPPEGSQDLRWAFEGVKYQISVVNWRDYRRTTTQTDTFTFQRDSADRGWHRGFLKASEMTGESGWLSEDGDLCLRAACSARGAVLLINSGGNRRAVGHVGLKNHGATCYMNCLLQTLYHMGQFRHIVYSIDCQDPEPTITSAEDPLESGAMGDERPALPLLLALQNLFYRLQTSDVPVSCRELMRSFGWDTADAFMQHDAQELNRLLCDRLEEQMKGTAMDGAIKRLFEGEMQNYIECIDVDCRSTRNETFYDLQLNVRNDAGRDLRSLEESLRDFTNEETLDDENAYDAGCHGKQRARKGIRFKRFPPVLHIQLKRFMFDAERMDMCKLNGRVEYPVLLDLEAFAPGSGKYVLHTVVVHSGGVSSGHYYAFVHVNDGERNERWVKFDDEQVTTCSEHAAVEDNYGGEDPMVWSYFHLPPSQLKDKLVPTVQRIHNAYMLSYVRADLAEQILKAPNLDDEARSYRRLVDRCVRESRLAEERRRAKMEQATRIDVRLLLERDLTTLHGFWSHHDLPYSHRLRMSRDQPGEDLWRDAEGICDVSMSHIALFLLHTRKTRQTRFKFMDPRQALRQHLTAHGAPHSSSADPHLVVLCVVSRGYDPHSLVWHAPPGTQEVPHDIKAWTDDICLLIVKYFCPTMQRLVTLGCYYCHIHDPLEVMVTERWLEDRLKPYVDRKEVAVLAPGTDLICWEEYCFSNPKDVLERNITTSIEKEGLYVGDVVIWQPAPPSVPRRRMLEGPRRPPSVNGTVGATGEEEREEGTIATRATDDAGRGVDEDGDFPVLTARDLATRQINQVQVSVRLHSADAPWRPDGVPADGQWGTLPETSPLELLPEDVVPEADTREFTSDARWSMASFTARVARAFGLADSVGSGQPFWLFGSLAPVAEESAPLFRSEAPAPRRRETLGEICPRAAMAAQQRVVFHAVLLPRPLPDTQRRRPVVVHFFDQQVREVGACVFHVTDVDAEELPLGDDEPERDSHMDGSMPTTGRCSVDPSEVLEMCRRHLDLQGNEQLRAKLALAGGGLPLRLLDISRGRIRNVQKDAGHPSAGTGTPEVDSEVASPMELVSPRVWPARGHNFLACALRVEPDCDSVGEAVTEQDLPDGDVSEERAAQMVEVFHAEPNGHAFGHPFLLRVASGERAASIFRRLQVKLVVPECELRMWNLLLVDEDMRTPLEETDEWPIGRTLPLERGCLPWSPKAAAFCVERLHPAHRARSPVAGRSLRMQKPLTIRAS